MDKEVLLTNYFSNRLTKDEKKLFNELLASDSDFKAQFDFEQNLQRAIKNKENQDLKSKLISFEKDIVTEGPKSTQKKTYRHLAIAASIVMLIGLAWMGYTDGSSDKYEDLYAANFQEYPNTVYTITRSGSNESLEREAFVAYESGNYDVAVEKFNKIPLEQQQAYTDFYLAQSYLNAGKNESAKKYFKKTIANADAFIAESHWFLAMIALKEKDKIGGKIVIKWKKEKALAILEELN